MKLSIWVTKTCNMACSYCYEEGLIREDTGVCEIDYIEKTIEFINTMCYKTASKKIFIKFFGGEPLIKFPFIKKFVEIANEKIDDKITPFYSITTNGTLMTDDMLIWLKKNNVECALSIDGDEEIYSMEVVETIFNTDKKAVERLRYYIERDAIICEIGRAHV